VYGFDDPIGAHTLICHFFESYNWRTIFCKSRYELSSTTDFSLDEIITEEDKTWLISDPGPSMQECIAISTRQRLTDIGNIGEMRYSFDEFELFDLSFFYESLLEFERSIKMVLDRLFPTTCDDHDICDTGTHCFFHKILDYWLVDDGEHLLGLSFGSREEPSTESRSRDDTLTYDM
jgi:hypothetical protein